MLDQKIPYKYFILQGLYFCFNCSHVRHCRIKKCKILTHISMLFLLLLLLTWFETNLNLMYPYRPLTVIFWYVQKYDKKSWKLLTIISNLVLMKTGVTNCFQFDRLISQVCFFSHLPVLTLLIERTRVKLKAYVWNKYDLVKSIVFIPPKKIENIVEKTLITCIVLFFTVIKITSRMSTSSACKSFHHKSKLVNIRRN